MKAIRVHEWGGPEVLRYEDVPDPVPGFNQVVIRVHAVGVNPVETYVRTGTYAVKPPLPYTPGADCAGVIEAVGEKVTRFQVGDRVYTSATATGAYAEKTLAEADVVYPLPENISYAQGAGANTPYATAYRALIHRAKAQSGETVLVHGASGGVGIAAVQIARSLGLTVFGTASTEEGRALIQKEGAHYAFDHQASDYLEQAKAQTPDGAGFDIILEMLANVNLDKDLPALARYGRVVIVGNRGRIEINPRDAMQRDADIRGMTLFNITPVERDRIHAALYAGFENGTLRPIIGRELPLSKASEAHEIVMSGTGSYGKLILVP